MNNKHELQVMAAAAQKAADGTEPLPLDDEVRRIVDRGWLRKDLAIDPKCFARDSLVMAVERGMAEQQGVYNQSTSLAQWRSLSDEATKARKSLDSLSSRSKFTIGDLQVLCAKQHLATTDFSGSINAALRAVQRKAHGTAEQLYKHIIAARQAAANIADQANAMAENVAKLTHDPGEPFRRGFAIEMMKTWWLLTDRTPSSKQSETGNPYAAFADAGLQSINSNPDLPSCAGVTRSALPIFIEWKESSLSDDVLDKITGLTLDEITGDTPPDRNRVE